MTDSRPPSRGPGARSDPPEIAPFSLESLPWEDEDRLESRAPSSESDFERSWACQKLVDHIHETLRKRPGIDAVALGGSIEIFRMIQSLPASVLPAGGDVALNKARWCTTIERVGTADVTALVEALRGPR